MIFYMPLSSFYPLMTSDYFQASAWHGSAVEVLYAAGMMIAAFLFGSVIKVKRYLFLSYIGLLGIGFTSTIGGILPPEMWAWFIFALVCGIMGAFGAALIARERYEGQKTTMLSREQMEELTYTTSMTKCHGCTNNCRLTVNKFSGGRRFISGNRCERGAGVH